MGKTKARPAGITEAHGADERRSARSAVILAAEIESDNDRVPVRVLNLSAHGVLVHAESMAEPDEKITFHCNSVAARGWVAWVRHPLAGIHFGEPIKPAALRVKPQSAANMVTKDTRKLDFRRPGFRGNQMTEEEREIVEQWMRKQDEAAE